MRWAGLSEVIAIGFSVVSFFGVVVEALNESVRTPIRNTDDNVDVVVVVDDGGTPAGGDCGVGGGGCLDAVRKPDNMMITDGGWKGRKKTK